MLIAATFVTNEIPIAVKARHFPRYRGSADVPLWEIPVTCRR
jgi:hypothetical protein